MNRPVVLLLGLVLIVAVANGFLAVRWVPPCMPTRDDIERDLVLKVEPYQADLAAGNEVSVRDLVLVNTSRTTTHRVVQVGDGSWEGRREPYVYFTGERETAGGRWEPVKPERWGVCKHYAWNWQTDVIELKPGEALSLGWAITSFNLQHPGRVRITAHYEYMSRKGWNDQNDLPVSDRGAMGDCPAYHLASSPVTLTVSRPLDVKVRAKRKLKAGEAVNLSDVIEATVTNTTANPIELTELGSNMSCGSHLTVVSDGFEQVKLDGYRQVYGRKMMLAAWKTAGLFGGGDFTNGADAKVTAKKSGTYRVLVIYSPQVNNGGSIGPQLTTETEIVVEP